MLHRMHQHRLHHWQHLRHRMHPHGTFTKVLSPPFVAKSNGHEIEQEERRKYTSVI
jgi:hypothetical protein